jgi:hypothetical protein
VGDIAAVRACSQVACLPIFRQECESRCSPFRELPRQQLLFLDFSSVNRLRLIATAWCVFIPGMHFDSSRRPVCSVRNLYATFR